jgi:hypothetical protein
MESDVITRFTWKLKNAVLPMYVEMECVIKMMMQNVRIGCVLNVTCCLLEEAGNEEGDEDECTVHIYSNICVQRISNCGMSQIICRVEVQWIQLSNNNTGWL